MNDMQTAETMATANGLRWDWDSDGDTEWFSVTYERDLSGSEDKLETFINKLRAALPLTHSATVSFQNEDETPFWVGSLGFKKI